MQDRQYDGVVLEDKWGKTYLCSSCLLARADLGEDYVTAVKDSEFGRYFLHDLFVNVASSVVSNEWMAPRSCSHQSDDQYLALCSPRFLGRCDVGAILGRNRCDGFAVDSDFHLCHDWHQKV